jgi:PAS domain S-box-containing protein
LLRAAITSSMNAFDPLRPALQHFLQHSREYAVIVLDADGRVVEWLGAAQEVLGYTPQEILGRPASELFVPEDREKGFDELELAIARASGRAEDDRWHRRSDGTKVWVTGSVEAVCDVKGAVTAYVKVLRDRTDLHMQTENLESRLRCCESAAQRTRAFLRTLGHEMRNPLAPLHSAATIVQRTSQDPRADKAVDIIFGQIEVLTRLANDLMEVSRLDGGQLHLNLERHDMRKLLAEAHEAFRAMATDRGLKLILMIPKGPLWVDVDKAKFRQVAHNLVSNAIKYTPRGGSVWIKGTQEAQHVLLRIEDNGMGISPELLPQLFELFSRGTAAEEVAPSGMGIGLAVVRELVALHRGSVQARSSGVGKGSEFTARFPAADLLGPAPGA